MTWHLDGKPLRRVLVTRLRYLGDVVMSTVVLDALRRGDPQIELGYLCEAAAAPVLAGLPGLDHRHVLGSRRRGADARARGGGHGGGIGTLALVRALRARRYDLAVDLFFNPRSAWLLRFGVGAARIGGARSGRRRLYTHTVESADIKAARPEFAARAGGALGDHLARLAPLRLGPDGPDFCEWLAGEGPGALRPRLEPDAFPASAVETVLTAAGLHPGDPYLLVAPGATWRSKEWPAGSWRDALSRLSRYDLPPRLILPPPGGAARWRGLADGLDGTRLLPEVPLSAALALAAGADGVLSVDGGLMHAAVALGRPTVALFGPTDPGIWFPYEGTGPFRVLCTRPACHPCDLHDCGDFVCLPDLAAETVVAALRDVLAETGAVS